MKKTVAYNTLVQLVAKIISMGLTLITTVIITRALGKEGYGQFSIMQTLPALFFILSDFGLNATALKKIHKNGTNAQSLYQTIISIRPILSLILIVLLNVIVAFLPYSNFLKIGVFMSSFWILTQSLFSGTNLIFQYKQRYDLASIGYILGSVLTTFLVYGFIKLGLDVRFLSFSYVLGGLATFIVNAHILTKHGFSTKLTFSIFSDKKTLSTLLSGSIPLGLMFVFSQINFKADGILLSLLNLPARFNLSNIDSVAIYALPYKVFEVSLAVPTFIMNASYPVFVARLQQSRQDLNAVVLKTVKLTTLLGLAASITLIVFAPLAIAVLGGAQFSQSVQVLKILGMGLFLFYITQPLAYYLVTIEKQKVLPVVYIVGAVFNVTANVLFIPKYSFYTSAYITWLSEGLILLLLGFFVVKNWRGGQSEVNQNC